jgi:hypothetical protein
VSLSLHKENGRFFTQFHNFLVSDKVEFCEPELATHKCEFREHFGDGNRDATSEEREESSRIPDTRGWSEPAATNAPVEDEPVEPLSRMNISLPASVFFSRMLPAPKFSTKKIL